VKDYHKILEVSQNADEQEIKKSYRRLAMKYHPDKNPGDKTAEEKFKEIAEAYEYLSNPAKRNQKGNYSNNQYGNPQNQKKGSPFEDFFNMDDFYNFGKKQGHWSTFYDDLYTKSYGGKGKDVEINVPITLEEAYHGVKRTINLNNETFTFDVKPGVKDGQVLKFKDKGEKGSIANGDALLKILIQEDIEYVRRENDLYKTIAIDMYTAILGGEFNVSTFEGLIKIKIPEGIQSGKNFRVAGKGMPVYGNSEFKGSLFLTINVQTPTNISQEEKELIIILKELSLNRK